MMARVDTIEEELASSRELIKMTGLSESRLEVWENVESKLSNTWIKEILQSLLYQMKIGSLGEWRVKILNTRLKELMQSHMYQMQRSH